MTANQMIGPEAMRALLLNNEGRWDTPEIADRHRRLLRPDARCGLLP